MTEAVAGLSLAANILQMVEYGGVFVTTALKIYSEHTDTDIVKDFKQLQYRAKHVENVLESLDQDIHAFSSTATRSGDGDPQLARLAEECRKVMVEILEFVDQTGDQKSWRTRMHKAVKEAFQLTWGQEKLAKLQTKLDGMTSQLILRLVYSLRNHAAASTQTQDVVLCEIKEEMKRLNYKIDQGSVLGLGTASVDLISQKLAGKLAGRRSEEIRESLKSAILQVISEPGRAAENIKHETPKMSPSMGQTLQQKLLENLSYPDMLVREESVVRASEKTFRWIFEREKRPDHPWASFCEWLEAPDKQLYWITGKPGSGKSTLMKFISQPDAGKPGNEPRCSSFLHTWAKPHPLIVSSYYFWAVGSPMQRSSEGMLRTLLHGLLSQVNQEVVASIMPESWEALHLFGNDPRPYTEGSLRELLSRAFDYMCRSMKICLFIDGLDEFKGQHEELVSYLSAAIRTHPIKLCVSSRQWQVFEDRFRKEPSLRLQDLTLPDMVEYVRSELYNEPALASLQELDPSFPGNFDQHIALRADGVFLWLNLVVKSLRKGIRAGDSRSELEMRLGHLPQDLEALFDRILDELDKEYLDRAIQYFQLMEARREIGPPNIMVFCYAEENDERVGLCCSILPLDEKTYKNKRDQLKKRLNTRCMGLLEITEQPPSAEGVFFDASQSRVNYLHKSFGDYVSKHKGPERLRRADQRVQGHYDPHLRFCSSELAFRKSAPLATNRLPSETLDTIKNTSLRNSLLHAAKVQGPGLESMVRLVDAAGNEDGGHREVLYFELRSSDPLQGQRSISIQFVREVSVVPLMIDCGVVEYIRVKVQQRSQAPKFWNKVSAAIRKRGRSSTVEGDAWSNLDWQLGYAILTSRNPAIVDLLLKQGAHLQSRTFDGVLSNWQLALVIYMHVWHEVSQVREEAEHIVELMVKYGATIEWKFIRKAYLEMQVIRSMHHHRQALGWLTIEPETSGRKEILGRDDTFCSIVESKLKSIKQGLQ